MRLSRREILRAVGAGAGLLPLLQGVPARAATAPRRLLILTKGGGTVADQFWPQATSSDLRQLTLPPILASLEPHKADINLLGGLEFSNCSRMDGHLLWAGVLTGRRPLPGVGKNIPAAGASLDVFVADALAKREPRPVHSLLLSTGESPSTQGPGALNISWRGERQPNVYENDPYRVFDRLFVAQGAGAPEQAGRVAEDKSQLAFAMSRLAAFSRRFGAEDRRKVEAHLEALGALAKQTDRRTDACSATAPERMANGAPLPTEFTRANEAEVPRIHKMQLDLVMSAFRCDLTRVALVNIGDSYGERMKFGWVPGVQATDSKLYGHYHGVKHNTPADPADAARLKQVEVAIETWFASQLAYVLAQLKAVPEGTGTMLDNTAVLWADALANGTTHSYRGVPWIVAGRCGGALRTGQLLRYGAWASAPAASYWKASGTMVSQNGALVALCTAMGVGPGLVDPAFGDTPLPGLL